MLKNKNIAWPTSADFFSTPLNSIYSVFRLFTVEGWYEIPDAMAEDNNDDVKEQLRQLEQKIDELLKK